MKATAQETLSRGPGDALPRRRFLERFAAILPATAVALAARPASAAADTGGAKSTRAALADGAPPDEAWLHGLRGKHRTVFDVEAHRNGRALAQAKGFLDAYEEAYEVPARDVNLVLGVRGTGLPLVLADAVWTKYRMGERYDITDPSSGTASTRNLYTTAHVQASGPVTAAQTVEALQRRGVLFLVCDNTLAGATRTLAAAGLGAPDAIGRDLLAGILPGVVRVPAMVIAFSRMQERGVSYVYAG